VTELFATPVDPERLVVRHAPETALIVIPMQAGGRAQVFAARPISRPALSIEESEALRAYFDWEADPQGYWWRTLRPAVARLERVTSSTWSATLESRGELVAAGHDPRLVPDVEWSFRTLLPRDSTTLRDPHGPQLAPDALGETVMVRSEATRIVRAVFPSVSPEPVWVRLFNAGYERDAHLRALRSELEAMAGIAAASPGFVTAPLHDGMLETEFHEGRYVATELPVGFSLHDVATTAGQGLFPSPAVIAHGVALDAVRVMAIAHAAGYCLGPLSPGLLRLRPSFAKGQEVRSSFVALPGAGVPGSRLAPSIIEQFPEGSAPRLVSQFARAYQRSVKVDLVGLGHLVSWITEIGSPGYSGLDSLAAELRSGWIETAARALATIEELVVA
jgi:hypothetical protein